MLSLIVKLDWRSYDDNVVAALLRVQEQRLCAHLESFLLALSSCESVPKKAGLLVSYIR